MRPPRPGRKQLWAFVPALVFLVSACPSDREVRAEPIRLGGSAFGTTWSVVFVPAKGEPAPPAAALDETIRGVLDRVDSLMSRFREDSELVRFNRAGGLEPFFFDPETRRVIDMALGYAKETGGAFDPTVGPLVRVWGFGAGAMEGYPSSEAVEEAAARVGWSLLSFDDEGGLFRAVPGVELDLSAIAKGHGVDAVFEALSRSRPSGLLVEIGGDLRVGGARADGGPWRLGIQAPAGGLESTIRMTSGALATSGDYRQRIGEGEARRTHIIDPRTNRPTGPATASASVLAPTAMEADAAATALMVMGAEEGLAFVEARPWLEAQVITRRPGEDEVGEVQRSSGWPAAAAASGEVE